MFRSEIQNFKTILRPCLNLEFQNYLAANTRRSFEEAVGARGKAARGGQAAGIGDGR